MTPATLPDDPIRPIRRESLIEGLLFEAEKNPVVIVNGPSNVGKTTLLLQFYQEHISNTITTFLNSTSPWGYEFEYIVDDLCRQADALINAPRKEPSIETDVPTTKWRNAVASLSRIKNPPHSAIFFILDGLDNLPDSEESTAKALFSLLPLGRRGFRFLISGSRAAKYLNSNSPKCYGEFSVTGFTQEEASTYLNDLLPVDEVKKLYALSKLPGYFANVRPIIQAQGKLPDPPLSTVQKVYEYEWEKIGGDSQTERLLAYLAFTKSTPSCVTAAKFLSISPPEVEALITRTAFIDLRGDIICFKHDSVAAFCRGKVKHLEQQVVDRLIEGFLHNSTTDEGVSQLPELFAQAGRYDELLAYMDDAYLVNALRQRRAARFIQEKALIGLKAAVKRENSEQVIRFGLQGANLDELYFDDHWAPRIQAFISIGALPRAFEIARSFTLPEDRLQALCHIAIEQKELNGRAEETLLDEITREYALLDKEHLGERAYDIATDLVKLLPKLALELIRRQSADTASTATTELERKQNSVDPQVVESADESARSAIEILQSKIKDPALRSLNRLLQSSSKEKTGEEILAEVERMTSDEEKSYFLRLWLAENKEHGGREPVIRYAIRFGISSKNVSPTPAYFLDAVRSIEGLSCADELIEQVRSVTPLLKRLGPTLDYYQLMLRIVEIEAKNRVPNSTQAAESLLAEIEILEDPATRAALYAEQQLLLHRCKEAGVTSFTKEHYQKAQNALETVISIVLERTADHYQSLRRCISRVARYDCEYAGSIVSRFNTEDRRNLGYSAVVHNALANRVKSCDAKLVTPLFAAISNQDLKDRCLVRLLQGLSASPKKKTDIFHFSEIQGWCESLQDPLSVCLGLAHYFVALVRIDGSSLESLGNLKAEIAKRITAIEPSIQKINCLHTLTFILAPYDKASAQKYLESAEKLRGTLFIKSTGVERCLVLNIRTTLRALGGLVKRRAYTDVELQEVINMILKIPSVRARADLFSELAIRFHIGGNALVCRNIVSEQIAPLLEHAPVDDVELKADLDVVCASASYFANPVACIASLETMPDRVRNDAVNAIIRTLIAKQCPSEPRDGSLTFDDSTSAADLTEILRLADYLNDDSVICYYIKAIVRFLSLSRSKITKGEREELVAKIAALVAKKLPSPFFRSHNGYQLLGEAYVFALRGAKELEWRPLIERVKRIPNISDRALVLSIFADLMSGKMLTARRTLLREALEDAQKIPVAYDRGDRTLFVAEVAQSIDREIFNAAIQGVAGRSTAPDRDERSMDLKRRAVDLLYYEDEKLANQLVSALDDEPARDVKEMLGRRIEFLNLQSRINRKELAGLDLCASPDVPAIFWRNLRRLNAGMIEAPKFKALVPLFAAIEGRRIEDVYPILCFGIESCVRNYEDTEEAFGVLARIFRVCLSSARLVVHCLSEIKELPTVSPRGADVSTSASRIIVNRGQRDLAVDFLRSRLANESAERVYVVDPYFTADDLDLVQIVRSQVLDSPICVMTSRKKIQAMYGNQGASTVFRNAWRSRFGDRGPGDVKIFVVGRKDSGEPPIHDRFVLLDKVGVKLGGSWNGVGGDKQMDLSALNSVETTQWRREAERYMLFMQSTEKGTPLVYDVFNL